MRDRDGKYVAFPSEYGCYRPMYSIDIAPLTRTEVCDMCPWANSCLNGWNNGRIPRNRLPHSLQEPRTQGDET